MSRTQLAKTVRYYAFVVVSWVLAAWAIASSGAGKSQPSTAGVVLACVLGFLTLVFLVFAILSLPAEQRSSRAWEPIVTLVLVGAMSAAVVPVLISSRSVAKRSTCLLNAKVSAQALIAYTVDHDEKLPGVEGWMSVTSGHRSGRNTFKCPEATLPYSYSMNRPLSRTSIGHLSLPDQAVLVFECDSSRANPGGEKRDFVPRHSERGSIGYADGHAKLIGRDDIRTIWKPRLALRPKP